MRKVAAAVLLFATIGVATASAAGASSGTSTVSFQCVATYTGGSTSGLLGTTIRDQLKTALNDGLAANPVSGDLNYDTPDTGAPGVALATNPTFGVDTVIPEFVIPNIDGVEVKQATLTVNTGGFGTVNLAGAGVSPSSLQSSIPVPTWSPLDLKNPPAGGVAAAASISGEATPSAPGAITYQPGAVRLKVTLYAKVGTFLGDSTVTQPITLDCTPIAPQSDIGPGTVVAEPDPYPCRADRPVTPHSFTDVSSGAYFNDSVSWLVASDITSGTGPGVYSPGAKVVRGQMAAFLWRMECTPTPASGHGFTDVSGGAYYNNAVSWLVGANITSGTGPGTYAPNDTVTRAQMATFLWRLAGSPLPGSPAAFTDVAAGAYYGPPVAWLVEAGITTGTSPTTFSPNDAVTRGQMAVFLDRYDVNT